MESIAQAGSPGDGAPYRLLVLRQITAEPLAPYLKVGGRALGIEAELAFGQFDTMVQDIHDDALWREAPDAILVCPALERFAPKLAPPDGSVSPETADELTNDVATSQAMWALGYRRRSPRNTGRAWMMSPGELGLMIRMR